MTEQKQLLRSACKDFEEDLVLYYYGDFPKTEFQRIEAHLKECGSCREFLDDLRKMLPLTTEPQEFPQAFWDSYYRETLDKLATTKEPRRWWQDFFGLGRPWPLPALAGALVLVLAVTLVLTKGGWRSQNDLAHESPPREILSASGNLAFFESMDLVESLALLEELERTKKSERDDFQSL